MAASYPSSVASFTTKVNTTTVIDASHPNTVQDEVVALQQFVGVNPHVSTAPSSGGTFVTSATTYASLSARLANIETGVVSDAHTQYMHKAGGDTIQSSGTGVVGLTLRAIGGQSVNQLEVQDSASVVKVSVNAAGLLTSTNATIGTLAVTGTVIDSAALLDLADVSQTAPSNTGSTGDKVALHGTGASFKGFGVQTGALVVAVPVADKFAVRVATASGNATSGTEVFSVTGAGNTAVAGTLGVTGASTVTTIAANQPASSAVAAVLAKQGAGATGFLFNGLNSSSVTVFNVSVTGAVSALSVAAGAISGTTLSGSVSVSTAALSVSGTSTLSTTNVAGTLSATTVLSGSAAGLNVLAGDNSIQGRNVGAASALSLNPSGGLVNVGSGGLTATGNIGAPNLDARPRGRVGFQDTTSTAYVTAETVVFTATAAVVAGRRYKATFQMANVDADGTNDTTAHGTKGACITRIRAYKAGVTAALSGTLIASVYTSVFDDDSGKASGVNAIGYFTAGTTDASWSFSVTQAASNSNPVRYLDTNSVGFLVIDDDGV